MSSLLLAAAFLVLAQSSAALESKQWIHGAEDCEANPGPAIEVFQYSPDSYILRQSKCISYEAPFIYVLMGQDRTLVLDTGAPDDTGSFNLYDTVLSLQDKRRVDGALHSADILVIHSHSHRDHHAGDSQFAGRSGVTVIEPERDAVRGLFATKSWPDAEARLQLGARELTVVPIPGHQEESIAVYDPQTGWLLTGDTVYPGYIYVKHWQDYRRSITRLAAFLETHEVSAVLGAHIEMTRVPGESYPIGMTYQPNEASLVLSPEVLLELDMALQAAKKPQKIEREEFIVAPMNPLQKGLSNVARWLRR